VIYIWLNLLPIFAATVAGFLLSIVWLRRARRMPSPGNAVLLFIAQAWLCAILAGALILAPDQAGRWVMALGTPVVIWAGFVLPSLFATLRLRNVAPARALGDCLMWLAATVLQAFVLESWGLVPPPG
jgi:FtsH-binding integral membrane protein